MKKYEYIGNEDKVYYDPSGNRFPLSKGDIIELKVKPDWEDIVDRSEEKKKYLNKLDKEDKKNDSSK